MKQNSVLFLVFVVVVLITSGLFLKDVVVEWIPHRLEVFGGGISRAATAVQSFVSTTRTVLQKRESQEGVESMTRELTFARAQIDELTRELQNLQSISGVFTRSQPEIIQGGIYTTTSVGGVRRATLNRGSLDRVSVGDIVATPQGQFVGVVTQVQRTLSVVQLLGDLDVSVTARVLQSNVTGLVRALSPDKLIMDLVQKDEVITQGATIVTSGDDQVPAGLIIGTVYAVDSEAASLFQLVRVTPAVRSILQGDVFIVHRLRE